LDEPGTRRRPAFWIWLAVGVVAFVAVVAVIFYVTGEASFCGSCHEMQPEVNGWRAGTHKDVSCFACHSDPGVIGYLKAHVGDGLRDVWVHFTQRPETIVVKGQIIPQSRCLACHGDKAQGKAPAFPTPQTVFDHPDRTSYCPECHRDSIHGKKP
jgi:nitrate/TMAO reductase-like tetraheme cytochrome c subunit